MSDPFPMEGLFGPQLPFKQGAKYAVRTYRKTSEEDRASNEYKQARRRVLDALEEVAKRDAWLATWNAATAPISLDMERMRRASDLEGKVIRRRVRPPDGGGDDGSAA